MEHEYGWVEFLADVKSPSTLFQLFQACTHWVGIS